MNPHSPPLTHICRVISMVSKSVGLMLQATENSCFILALRTSGNVVMSTDLSLTDIWKHIHGTKRVIWEYRKRKLFYDHVNIKEVYNTWKKLSVSILIHLKGSCSADTGHSRLLWSEGSRQKDKKIQLETFHFTLLKNSNLESLRLFEMFLYIIII